MDGRSCSILGVFFWGDHEKLTLMSMTRSSPFIGHVNLSMMPAESRMFTLMRSCINSLKYIRDVGIYSDGTDDFYLKKHYMYLKQWSHQSHDTMTLSNTFKRSAIFMVRCH